MKRVLITGATGTVGVEVVQALLSLHADMEIHAGVRHPTIRQRFPPRVVEVPFDFENRATQANALQGMDVLFLLRPPQLADVKKYFVPLLQRAKSAQVKHIVFLSVQGVERSPLIPHHKIEKAIRATGIPFTFLRPAYFMQNFTTTLHADLVKHHRIFLPAGEALFTVVDTGDIGRVAAQVIAQPHKHANAAYDLTADEKLSFREMASILTAVLQTPIRYQSPNLLRFYLQKRKEGLAPAMIGVMMMLHVLPRFQKAPPLSDCIRTITGQAPVSFRQFTEQNRERLLSP